MLHVTDICDKALVTHLVRVRQRLDALLGIVPNSLFVQQTLKRVLHKQIFPRMNDISVPSISKKTNKYACGCYPFTPILR